MKDIVWLNPDGTEVSEEEWQQHFARCLGAYLPAAGLNEHDERGEPLEDDNFLILINAHHEEMGFKLPRLLLSPQSGLQRTWTVLLDTFDGSAPDSQVSRVKTGESYRLGARCLALLTQRRPRQSSDTLPGHPLGDSPLAKERGA